MVDSYVLKEKLEQFEPWQRTVITTNITNIQLNTHCPTGCGDCGLGARRSKEIGKPPDGDAMAWDVYTDIIDDYARFSRTGLINLFWKSEPFSYSSGGHNFRDAFDYLNSQIRQVAPSYVFTSVPEGSEDQVMESLDIVGGIDITHHEKRLEGFIKKVESEMPEYAGVFLKGNRNNYGENGGSHPETACCCSHGIVLTPDDILTVRTVRPSDEFPLGFDARQVTPDNFKIAASSWSPDVILSDISLEEEMFWYNRWLDHGYYEFTEPSEAILGPLLDYFRIRYVIQRNLTLDPNSLTPAIKRFITHSNSFSEQMGRPFNEFESGLMDELEELVKQFES